MNCQDCRHLRAPVWHEEIDSYLCDGECHHPKNKTRDIEICPLMEYDYVKSTESGR